MGRSSAAPQQQNEDGGMNPPLQRQDRRARPSPASLGTGEWLRHKNRDQQAKRDSSRENRATLSFSSKSWRRMRPTAVPLSCCHISDTSLCPYRVPREGDMPPYEYLFAACRNKFS